MGAATLALNKANATAVAANADEVSKTAAAKAALAAKVAGAAAQAKLVAAALLSQSQTKAKLAAAVAKAQTAADIAAAAAKKANAFVKKQTAIHTDAVNHFDGIGVNGSLLF